jgi:hypothetical protein
MRLLPRLEDKQKNLCQLTKLFHARSLVCYQQKSTRYKISIRDPDKYRLISLN